MYYNTFGRKFLNFLDSERSKFTMIFIYLFFIIFLIQEQTNYTTVH